MLRLIHIPGGTPILGHIRDVRPEWVTFPGQKPADGCKFFTKNLQMGHNFDIILPGNGWFSSKLNKTYCSLVNFYCRQSENGSVFWPALVCGWVNFPILWPHTLAQMKLKCPPPPGFTCSCLPMDTNTTSYQWFYLYKNIILYTYWKGPRPISYLFGQVI